MHPGCIICEYKNVYVIVIGIRCCFFTISMYDPRGQGIFQYEGAHSNVFQATANTPCFWINTSNTLLFQSKIFVGAIPKYNIAVASQTRRLSRMIMLPLVHEKKHERDITEVKVYCKMRDPTNMARQNTPWLRYMFGIPLLSFGHDLMK